MSVSQWPWRSQMKVSVCCKTRKIMWTRIKQNWTIEMSHDHVWQNSPKTRLMVILGFPNWKSPLSRLSLVLSPVLSNLHFSPGCPTHPLSWCLSRVCVESWQCHDCLEVMAARYAAEARPTHACNKQYILKPWRLLVLLKRSREKCSEIGLEISEWEL